MSVRNVTHHRCSLMDFEQSIMVYQKARRHKRENGKNAQSSMDWGCLIPRNLFASSFSATAYCSAAAGEVAAGGGGRSNVGLSTEEAGLEEDNDDSGEEVF